MAEALRLHPVILSGGTGSRLWPLSRANHPKQFLDFADGRSLLQATALRFADRSRFHPPLVIANNDHRFTVGEQLQNAGIDGIRILLEPVGRNTAPAAATAALLIRETDPSGIMILLPSDHVIGDIEAFQTAVVRAAEVAAQGYLVTFGIPPVSQSTEYGYIKRGDALHGFGKACRIDRFVEKPDAATAAAYLADGGYLWNSGMFVFPVALFLEELAVHRPDILAACERAVAGRRADLDFLRLEENAFAACPKDSIDYAVMEKTSRAAVVPGDFGWNDVGAWRAMWDLADKDAAANAVIGDVIAQDSRGSYLRSDGGTLVAALGVENLCVVATGDAVFVAPLERAAEVKRLVEGLERDGRTEAIRTNRELRPWGSFTDIERAGRFKVKRLVVKPGRRLSLQKHAHRSEHWVVVQGTATVVNGEREMTLERDQSTYITAGTVHRLENRGEDDLHLIEVQVGDYLEEDDIVRLEDDFKRG